jgi:hypothetical protein
VWSVPVEADCGAWQWTHRAKRATSFSLAVPGLVGLRWRACGEAARDGERDGWRCDGVVVVVVEIEVEVMV